MKFFKGKSLGQIVAFIIGLFLIVGGLTILVLGLVGDYGPRNNPFAHASSSIVTALKFGLTLTWIGFIVLSIGSITLVLSLNFMAKANERETEKETRRKQRLEVLKQSNVVNVDNIDSTAK